MEQERPKIEQSAEQQKDWVWQLHNAVRTVEQLGNRFNFTPEEKDKIGEVLKETRASITPYLLSLVETDKNGRIAEDDPIWLQYGPSEFEGQLLESETSWEKPEEMFADGLTDEERAKVKPEARKYLGQHKYPDKVVVRVAHHCGAYCRFCYERGRTLENAKMANLSRAREQAVEYLQQHPEIREVILTGGDPLALADNVLEDWLKQFNEVETIDAVRVHTRMPAQNPYRITPELVDMFKKYGIRWVNVQVNHPRELTDDLLSRLKLLQESGITVKTENPIIHRINDDPKVLAKFIRTCRAHGIQHHHWFHSMPVAPEQMRVSIERAVLLFQAVQKEHGGIRWNASELGDLVIPHHDGKRTIPFEEITIDPAKPREEWGTNKFQFTTDKNGKPIVRFTSWNPNSDEWQEYIDPHVDLEKLENSDFADLLKTQK